MGSERSPCESVKDVQKQGDRIKQYAIAKTGSQSLLKGVCSEILHFENKGLGGVLSLINLIVSQPCVPKEVSCLAHCLTEKP